MFESDLQRAERLVSDQKDRIAQQQSLVDSFKDSGWPLIAGEELLIGMNDMLVAFEAQVTRLRESMTNERRGLRP
jgi:hypothetical protein